MLHTWNLDGIELRIRCNVTNERMEECNCKREEKSEKTPRKQYNSVSGVLVAHASYLTVEWGSRVDAKHTIKNNSSQNEIVQFEDSKGW